jgi:thymidylate kinase
MLIGIEGVSTAGKSTLALGLRDALMGSGVEALALVSDCRELAPFETRLRDIVQDPSLDLGREEELLLFASRMAAKARVIRSLHQPPSSVILIDRFDISFMVFGHHVRGFDREVVRNLSHLSSKGVLPSCVVFLDIDFSQYQLRGGMERRTRLAHEGRPHFERTRLGFKSEYDLEQRDKLWIDTAAVSATDTLQLGLSFVLAHGEGVRDAR